jgi:hypothetical protein
MVLLIIVWVVVVLGVVAGVASRRGRSLPTEPPRPDAGPYIPNGGGPVGGP